MKFVLPAVLLFAILARAENDCPPKDDCQDKNGCPCGSVLVEDPPHSGNYMCQTPRVCPGTERNYCRPGHTTTTLCCPTGQDLIIYDGKSREGVCCGAGLTYTGRKPYGLCCRPGQVIKDGYCHTPGMPDGPGGPGGPDHPGGPDGPDSPNEPGHGGCGGSGCGSCGSCQSCPKQPNAAKACSLTAVCGNSTHNGLKYGHCYQITFADCQPLGRGIPGNLEQYTRGGYIQDLVFKVCRSTAPNGCGGGAVRASDQFYIQDVTGATTDVNGNPGWDTANAGGGGHMALTTNPANAALFTGKTTCSRCKCMVKMGRLSWACPADQPGLSFWANPNIGMDWQFAEVPCNGNYMNVQAKTSHLSREDSDL